MNSAHKLLTVLSGRALTVEQYIASLFANGEFGVAVNRDLSTSYQDDPGTVLADDTDELVKHITDLSGNNEPLTAASDAARVVLKPTGWQFNGSSQYLLNHDIATIVNGEDQPVSILMVGQVTGGAGTNRVAVSFGRAASATTVWYLLANTINEWRRDKQGDAGGGTVISNSLAIGSGQQLLIINDTGTVCTLYNRTTNTTPSSNDIGTLTLDRFVVGARIRTATIDLYTPLLLNTLIVINRTLTAQEIAQARALFA